MKTNQNNKPVPYILTSDSLTVVVDGKSKGIHRTHLNFGLAVQALKEKAWAKLIKVIDTAAALRTWSAGQITIENGAVLYEGKVVANVVCDRILQHMNDGIDHTPLVKFLRRLMLNPDERCREALYIFLEKNNIPIDQSSGNIIAYKSLRADMTDQYTGTVKNVVGKTVRWGDRPNEKKVDVQFGQGCASSGGYHCGSEAYSVSFGGEDRIVCVVSVDPAKIVSTASESSEQKIRTLEYTPLGIYRDGKPFKANTKLMKRKIRNERVEKGRLRKTRNITGQVVLRGSNGKFASKS